MDTSSITLIAIFCLTVIFGVIGYLLSRKDSAQEKSIEDLYEKHQKDADKLAALELLVASDHYRKPEVDSLFKMLRDELKSGFDRVETAIHEIKYNGKKFNGGE